MNISRMYFLLCANFLATIVVAYYKKCYDEFSICLITNTDNPYYNNKFTLTQSSAEEWCRANSSSLVIITNENVQSAIVKFINDSDAQLSWDVITYGSRLNLGTWKWINGQRSAIFPDSRNYYGNYRYAFLVVSERKAYVSFDSQASSKRKFICSYHLNPNDDECPDGYYRYESSCYKVLDEEVSWFDARSRCLDEEGIDLATFENGTPSLLSEWIRSGQYWIGLRKESWHWTYDQTSVDLKYSNWEDRYPGATTSDCLCLIARTGKWKNCDCSRKCRYICIQGSASSAETSTRRMTTTASKVNITIPEMTNTPTKSITITSAMTSKTPIMTTSTTKMTTRTTKMTTRTTKMTTRTTKMTTRTTKMTTRTTAIPTVGHSSSLSTLTHSLDDNYSRSNGSEKYLIGFGSEQTSGFLSILGIGIACLLILIFVIAAVVFIKIRRSRSHDHEPTNENCPPPMTYRDDAPNTLYAAVIPNTNEPVCSALEKNSNQTVYAELDLKPKRNISPTQRASNPGRFTSEESPSQAVYAEVNNCLPQETMNGRPEDPSEYDNIQMIMDSVYANSAQTKV